LIFINERKIAIFSIVIILSILNRLKQYNKYYAANYGGITLITLLIIIRHRLNFVKNTKVHIILQTAIHMHFIT
ncbi:hypothetical protein ACJX0J_037698, partial [Zea mays]